MNRSFLARSLHRWLGLLVGLQVLIWLSTGLYMVVVDLDFIHGDPLARNMQQAIAVPDSSRVSVADLLGLYPDATEIGLRSVLGRTLYTVTTPADRHLIDPLTGRVLSPLDEKSARELAIFHFNGEAAVRQVAWIASEAPMEIQSRRLPLWRIDFVDRFSTSFYIDPYDGALVARRHRFWRVFDLAFMLHIMDYKERTDVHNLLLEAAQVAGVSFTLTGLWLLFYSFHNRQKGRTPLG